MSKRKESLANLRTKSVLELKSEFSDLVKKMAVWKLEKGLARLKKTSDLIMAKTLMARILTVIKEKYIPV